MDVEFSDLSFYRLTNQSASLDSKKSIDTIRSGLARLKSCVTKLALALYTSAVLIAHPRQVDLPLAAGAATPTAGAED